METTVSPTGPPALATEVFGARLALALRYAQWFVGPGVERGLVGPREADRVWQRHIMNCAAVGVLIEPDSLVVDIGSGAGLPGIVLALARPDIRVVLVESMLRRSAFLEEVLADLDLPGVTVCRARAEELRGEKLRADVVTARAVAPMERLAGWAAPLLARDGVMLAIKGSGVIEEVSAGWGALRRAGLTDVRLVALAAGPAAVIGAAEASAMSGIRVLEQGHWDATGTGGSFVQSSTEQVPPAVRLALVAALRRRPQGHPAMPARGLG